MIWKNYRQENQETMAELHKKAIELAKAFYNAGFDFGWCSAIDLYVDEESMDNEEVGQTKKSAEV